MFSCTLCAFVVIFKEEEEQRLKAIGSDSQTARWMVWRHE